MADIKRSTQEFFLTKRSKNVSRLDDIQALLCVVIGVLAFSMAWRSRFEAISVKDIAGMDTLTQISLLIMLVISIIELYLGAKKVSDLLEALFFAFFYPVFGGLQQLWLEFTAKGATLKVGGINQYWILVLVCLLFWAINSGNLNPEKISIWFTKTKQSLKAWAKKIVEKPKASPPLRKPLDKRDAQESSPASASSS